MAGAAVINSYLTYEEFYPTVIHIVKSKSITLVLFNCAVACSVIAFKIITWVFFSVLKDAEVQNMESEAMKHGFNFIIMLYMLHLAFDVYIAFHICANIAVFSLHTLASKRVEYVIFN
jgi:E3 ubiquitin-protein ligase synoviolin